MALEARVLYTGVFLVFSVIGYNASACADCVTFDIVIRP